MAIPTDNVGDYGLCMDTGKEKVWLEEESPLSAYGLQDGVRASPLPSITHTDSETWTQPLYGLYRVHSDRDAEKHAHVYLSSLAGAQMGVVKFMLRPTPALVVLPDGAEKTLFVHKSHNVNEVVAEICEQAKLDVRTGYSLFHESGVQLDDWKPLRDQNFVPGETKFVLKQVRPSPFTSNTRLSALFARETRRHLVQDATKAKELKEESEGGCNVWLEPEGNVCFDEKEGLVGASLNRLIEFLTSEKEYGTE